MAGMTAAGGAIGTMIAPGPGTAIGAGVGGVLDIVSMIMNYNEGKKAQDEARSLNERALASEEERNRFAEKVTKESLAEQKKQNRFSNLQTTAGNMMGIHKDAIDQLTNLFNTNTALRNNVLKAWGM